MNKDRK